ncbi:uncharacterized protein LOC128220164 [Mya arenaria]|uniref:uncharacterized protein LOC128220164 n=1 Tax=Mya arenaria TaxID=6604 RepID=UPI0022E88E5E|nr:uncharacterized protein LOC128220164 [Mya arenaria]
MGHNIIIVMIALSTFAFVTGQKPWQPSQPSTTTQPPTTTQKPMQCKTCDPCDDNLSLRFSEQDCSGSCYTYKGVSEQGSKVYRKGCLTSGGITMKWDQEGCYNMDVDRYTGEMCVCNSHHCNTSPALTIPLFTLLSASAAFVCVRLLI